MSFGEDHVLAALFFPGFENIEFKTSFGDITGIFQHQSLHSESYAGYKLSSIIDPFNGRDTTKRSKIFLQTF